jgi:hypothetical protein
MLVIQQNGRGARYRSTFTLPACTSPATSRISASSACCSCAGVPPVGWKPCSASLARTVSVCSARLTPWFSAAMAVYGVPAAQ